MKKKKELTPSCLQEKEVECQKCRKYEVNNPNIICWKLGLQDFSKFADNIWWKVRLKDCPGQANAETIAGDRVQEQVVQGVQSNF